MSFSRIVIVLGVGLLAGVVLALEFTHPFRYLAPDSFTYFTMARQVYDSGLLFSYSGVDHTTGIHPGFYFFLIPFYPLFMLALPAWTFVLGAIVLAYSMFLLYRAFGLTVASVVALFMLTPYGVSLTNNGMESSLVVLGLSLFAYYVTRCALSLTRKQALILGCLFGLIVFVRLDLIFVVMSFYMLYALSHGIAGGWNKETLKRVVRDLSFVSLSFGAIFFATLLLYIAYGGSPIPISGALKSSFPHLSSEWMLNLFRLKIFVASGVLVGGYLLSNYLRHRPFEIFVPTLFFASLALYFYNALFASGMGAWYGTLPFFAATLVAGLLLREIKPTRTLIAVPAFVLLLVFYIAHSHFTLSREDWVTPHRDAAAYLDEYASEGDAALGSQEPLAKAALGKPKPMAKAAGELKDGVFAFYSKRPTYSLTGLANDQEYVDAVRGGVLAEYFEKKHIAYVVGGSFYSGVQVSGYEELFIRDCKEPFYDTGIVTIFHTADCLPQSPGGVD